MKRYYLYFTLFLTTLLNGPSPHAAQLTPATANKPHFQEIAVELTTTLGDHHTYLEGDPISFLVSLDRDAHLLLVYKDADKNLVQLLPNRFSGNAFYAADFFIEIPGATDTFTLKAGPPFGTETFWMFAASTPFPKLGGTTLPSGLVLLDKPLTYIQNQLVRHAQTSGAAYGEASTTIKTVPKND